MKTTMITIVYEKENGDRVALRTSGSDAEAYTSAIENAFTIAQSADKDFKIPTLNWEEI